MKRTAIFAGTFDPPTLGHLDIIQKSRLICDELIVAIAHKPNKKSLFTPEERIEMLRLMTQRIPHIEVVEAPALLVTLAQEKKAHFLIRGMRARSDFDYEVQMAYVNRTLNGIETLFLVADEKHTHTSSTLVREIVHFKGPLQHFVPKEIEPLIRKKFT